MADYLPNRDGLLRSNLRDSIRRLKKIQKKAGKEDPEEEERPNTGDPFTDISTSFVILVTKTKLAINKKNTEYRLHGFDRINVEESYAIRNNIQEMEKMVQELKGLIDTAEKEYIRTVKKSKSKGELVKKSLDEKRSQYEDAVTTIDVVKEMNRELIAPGGAASTDITFSKKAQLREQLSGLDFTPAAEKYREKGGGEAGQGGGRLEDNEEYQQQMRTIKDQDEKIDAGLDRLRQGMARLRDLSENIGSELNVQNQMLERTEENMSRQSQQLYNLTNRITKLMKESSPINTFIYCCCVVLILSIIGFVLLEFGVI